jgi:hypothetical protein
MFTIDYFSEHFARYSDPPDSRRFNMPWPPFCETFVNYDPPYKPNPKRDWLDDLEAECKATNGGTYKVVTRGTASRFVDHLAYHAGQLIEMAQDSREGAAQRLREQLAIEVTERKRLEKQVTELQAEGTRLVMKNRDTEAALAKSEKLAAESRQAAAEIAKEYREFRGEPKPERANILLEIGQTWRHNSWAYPQRIIWISNTGLVSFDGGACSLAHGRSLACGKYYFTKADGFVFVWPT